MGHPVDHVNAELFYFYSLLLNVRNLLCMLPVRIQHKI